MQAMVFVVFVLLLLLLLVAQAMLTPKAAIVKRGRKAK